MNVNSAHSLNVSNYFSANKLTNNTNNGAGAAKELTKTLVTAQNSLIQSERAIEMISESDKAARSSIDVKV